MDQEQDKEQDKEQVEKTKKCNGCKVSLPYSQYKIYKNGRLFPRCLICYRKQARDNRKKRIARKKEEMQKTEINV